VGPSGNVGIGSAGSYGGGKGGVAFFASASTAPSSAPSGGFLEYGSGGAALVYGSGGALTTIADAGSGTINSQLFKYDRKCATLRTAGGATSTTTILSLTLASGHSVSCLVRVEGRVTVAGTSGMNVGDTLSTLIYVTYSNTGGSTPVLQGSANALVSVANGSASTMGSCSVSVALASNTINFQVTAASVSSPAQIGQIDWQIEVLPNFN
jgi:hypothetical protein